MPLKTRVSEKSRGIPFAVFALLSLLLYSFHILENFCMILPFQTHDFDVFDAVRNGKGELVYQQVKP